MGSQNITLPSINNGISSYSIGSESTGFFDRFSEMSGSYIFIFLFVLLLIGVNVFWFMSKGTEELFEFVAPIADKITPPLMVIISSVLELFGNISKFFISLFAKGSTSVINTSASEVNKSITSVQKIGEAPQSTTSASSIKYEPVEKNPPTTVKPIKANTLNRALDRASSSAGEYSADESSSSIQNSKTKGGWCFIGEERGVRTCATVGADDTCMSGDIFPSNEICVNPSLRA